MYEPGSVLAGKYRVERVIGRGGMGIVLAADHVELRSQVALKLLAERFVEKPTAVERFVREARAAAQLSSEHVCKVNDVGRLDDGTPFIVMERLEGYDLARVLRTTGPLSLSLVADYIIQACNAIGEAHAVGIVHRDLKPSNLFLAQRRDGSAIVKVLDFGVAKLANGADSDLTSTDNIMGSPHYMAPEQLRSAKAADARSDIWSLGIILCELTTGKPPFSGETIVDLAMRISNDPPTLTTTGMPPAFVAILQRCLQKDAALRFQTVAELADALAPLAAHVTAALPATGYTMPDVPSPLPTYTTMRAASGVMQGSVLQAGQPSLGRTRRVLVIAAVAAITIGIGGGLLVGVKGDRGGGHAAASQPTMTPVASQPTTATSLATPTPVAAPTTPTPPPTTIAPPPATTGSAAGSAGSAGGSAGSGSIPTTAPTTTPPSHVTTTHPGSPHAKPTTPPQTGHPTTKPATSEEDLGASRM